MGDVIVDTTDLIYESGDFIETNCHLRDCGLEIGTIAAQLITKEKKQKNAKKQMENKMNIEI